jgi:hypothetical protein
LRGLGKSVKSRYKSWIVLREGGGEEGDMKGRIVKMKMISGDGSI